MQDLKDRVVKDIMVKDVISVKISDSAFFVLEVFNEYSVSSVPVLNDDGNQILGFISERALLKTLGTQLVSERPQVPDINAFMTKDTLIVKEDDSIINVLQLFSEYGVKSALVVDKKEHLIGILTRRELLKSMEDCVHHEHGIKPSRRVPVRISDTYRERHTLSLAMLW